MPKRFLTRRDIEDAASRGAREIPIDQHTVVTDYARERWRPGCTLRARRSDRADDVYPDPSILRPASRPGAGGGHRPAGSSAGAPR